MPLKNKRSRNGFENFLKRRDKTPRLDLNNNEEIDSVYDMNDLNDSLEVDENEKSCKTSPELKEASTQTSGFSHSFYITPITSHFNLSQVNDLISILIDSIKEFNGKHRRILSVIVYLLLRLVFVPFHVFAINRISINSLRE